MSVSTAILLALVAGALNGSFAAPTKYTGRWKWENVWAVWAVVAFFIFPWVLALSTVPNLLAVYCDTDVGTVLMLIAFGAGYGVAAVCFGLGVAALGIALNFAIALGLSTAVGSLIPLFSLHRGEPVTAKIWLVLAGVLVTLIGIAVCAIAGRMKETGLRDGHSGEVKPTSFAAGLAFAIIAGIGSPLLNFGLAFGGPMLKVAAAKGASNSAQSNALWPVILTATLIPYLTYCGYLWRKNRSFGLYRLPGTSRYWVLGGIMGVLWMGSISIYGSASAAMAGMGPVLGWPLFMSAIIITSNLWGFATGEWRGVGRTPVLVMTAGMFTLIASFCILAYSVRV